MISVIIPSFNSVKTLKRAVDSCLMQDEVAEIIVIDDASTDDATLQLANELALAHPKVKSLALMTNSGPSAARNFGILNSKQPILAFLDADDEYLPQGLSLGYHVLMQAGNVAAVKLPCEFVDCPSKYTEHPSYPEACKTLINTFAGNLMIRREVMFALGLFSQDPVFRKHGGEDGALMVALRDNFLVGLIEQATPCVKIHFHADSHSQIYFEMAAKQHDNPSQEQEHDEVWDASMFYIALMNQYVKNVSDAFTNPAKGFVPVWKN